MGVIYSTQVSSQLHMSSAACSLLSKSNTGNKASFRVFPNLREARGGAPLRI
ncbi:hypothetical protein RYX36_013712 [Vicia faba]